MEYRFTTCELCHRLIFDSLEFQAFRLHRDALERVDLGGQNPYCGVRCICSHCIHIISLAAQHPGQKFDPVKQAAD